MVGNLLDTLLYPALFLLGIGVLYPIVIRGLFLIRDDQVGILVKKMLGVKLPEGHIIATKGEIGIQAQTLMPGLYWKFPLVWRIRKVPVTVIPPDKVGVVESVDGQPLQKGRILGDEADCDQYQNAIAFLDGDKAGKRGHKGPQIGVIRPGTYRINTFVFNVTQYDATKIEK